MASKTYTIGKGKLLFKPDGESGYKDLGNCPDFKFKVASEKKEHFSSRSGTALKDAEETVKQTAAGSFTLDEPNIDRLDMFVMGSGAVVTTQTAASITDQALTALLDRWVDIGKIDISNVVVTDVGAATTYVENTDYEIDAAAGLFRALTGGSITDAEALLIDFDYANATINQTNAATSTTLKGDIFFVGSPPVGKIVDIKGYASLSPNGELSMIGDDWMDFTFDIEFLESANYDGLFELIDRGTI